MKDQTIPEGPSRPIPVTSTDLFEHYCKLANKWGLFLSVQTWPPNHEDCADHLRGATMLEPSGDINDAGDAFSRLLLDEAAYLFFDDREAMEAAYDRIVGDEGPTESNPYDGPCRVYALTCRNDGQLLNENT